MDAPTVILIIACVAVGIAALFLLTLYFIYLYSFARRGDCGPFDGFDSPHMAPHKERSHKAIGELLAIDYEDIYISTARLTAHACTPISRTRVTARPYRFFATATAPTPSAIFRAVHSRR